MHSKLDQVIPARVGVILDLLKNLAMNLTGILGAGNRVKWKGLGVKLIRVEVERDHQESSEKEVQKTALHMVFELPDSVVRPKVSSCHEAQWYGVVMQWIGIDQLALDAIAYDHAPFFSVRCREGSL